MEYAALQQALQCLDSQSHLLVAAHHRLLEHSRVVARCVDDEANLLNSLAASAPVPSAPAPTSSGQASRASQSHPSAQQ
ncbi:hypothetical protein CAOG_009599 [Capsaspora owczarzaki ATCC 30864]|uniref:Uncharacterized protein n=1 Tax=Capsaspora owczarzaki (strain ATCC 30864) TaxID=595528 RepID=A0A0D2WNB9_CAPO3|nr:hypothetical protein CAOG_009599 [Capsaspora owczarzaki ATCC 30864]